MSQATESGVRVMKYTKNGHSYSVIDSGTELVATLPAGVFDVGCSKLTGCFLTERTQTDRIDFKVYGTVVERVRKSMSRFINGCGNLGILLSGEPGMGKTLFMRLISEKMVDAGYPVVIVSALHSGLSEFLGKIDQPFVVLVDEFEKLAHDSDDDEGATEFLTLLDGIRRNNMMFIAAVNRPERLNEMYFNRPGRFYYMFKFNRLSSLEIEEYMHDVLGEGHDEDIAKMVAIANVHHINYDVMRAVCNELKTGFGIEETLRDLNCTGGSGMVLFKATATVRGKEYEGTRYLELDQDGAESHGSSQFTIRNYGNDEDPDYVEFRFYDSMLKFDRETGGLTMDGSMVKIDRCRICGDDGKVCREIKPTELGKIHFTPMRHEAYSIASTFVNQTVPATEVADND